MYLHWANELSTVVVIFFSPCLASLTSHFPLAVTAEETNDERKWSDHKLLQCAVETFTLSWNETRACKLNGWLKQIKYIFFLFSGSDGGMPLAEVSECPAAELRRSPSQNNPASCRNYQITAGSNPADDNDCPWTCSTKWLIAQPLRDSCTLQPYNPSLLSNWVQTFVGPVFCIACSFLLLHLPH